MIKLIYSPLSKIVSYNTMLIILQLKLQPMDLSPRTLSPFRKPRISFMYQNSPISARKLQFKENSNNKTVKNIPSQFPPKANNKTLNPPLTSINPNPNANEAPQLCKCGRSLQYETVNTKSKLCAECGLKQMVNGTDELQIISHPKLGVSNVSTKSQRQPSRELEIEKLLKQIEDGKQSLVKLKQQCNEGDKQIKQLMKDKKVQLKAHYQKIKMAIKKSIDEDLKALEDQEKEEIQEWKENVSKLNNNMSKLQEMEMNLKEQSVKQLNQNQYIQLIQKCKIRANSINESHSTQIQVSTDTQDKDQLSYLYHPQPYRMITKDKRVINLAHRGGVLFSFQGRQ